MKQEYRFSAARGATIGFLIGAPVLDLDPMYTITYMLAIIVYLMTSDDPKSDS